MRKRLHPRLRLTWADHPWEKRFDDQNGAFEFLGPEERRLYVIASNELGWDHVSVSVVDQPDVTPTWGEMCFVKDLFFEANEPVIQYHPARRRYVNVHAGCLHLWRPQDVKIPMPPPALV